MEQELSHIRQHTKVLQGYSELEELTQYPEPVQKLLKKFARIPSRQISQNDFINAKRGRQMSASCFVSYAKTRLTLHK